MIGWVHLEIEEVTVHGHSDRSEVTPHLGHLGSQLSLQEVGQGDGNQDEDDGDDDKEFDEGESMWGVHSPGTD